jgi:hypothetical protein
MTWWRRISDVRRMNTKHQSYGQHLKGSRTMFGVPMSAVVVALPFSEVGHV